MANRFSKRILKSLPKTNVLQSSYKPDTAMTDNTATKNAGKVTEATFTKHTDALIVGDYESI